jgi:hypothetical protein
LFEGFFMPTVIGFGFIAGIFREARTLYSPGFAPVYLSMGASGIGTPVAGMQPHPRHDQISG